jgi:prolipoprotein diacylglyceryl transferase
MAVWAVVAGIVGARLYHVMTDWSSFEDDPVRIFQIWKGGLGIPGGLLLGIAVGWWVTKRRGIDPREMAAAAAPAIPLAQSIGRWGNWFNQELFGAPTDLPWGLEIDGAHRPGGYEQFTTFHPTFLYESLWLIGVAVVVIWADKRFRMGHGRAFALYVLLYCAGRLWIESLRIDEANHILGLRLNVWTSIIVGLGAIIYLLISARQRPGRETVLTRGPVDEAAEPVEPVDEAAEPVEPVDEAPETVDPAIG